MRRRGLACRGFRRLALGLAVFSFGCSSRIATQIRLDDLEFDYAFLVVLRPDGAPVRVTQPFGREGDRIIFGQQPNLELDQGDGTFVLVALTKDDLQSREPPFDPLRASELGVALELPPERPTLVEASPELPSVLRSAIPSGARLYAGAIEEGALDAAVLREVQLPETRLSERITVLMPVDPEHCRIQNAEPLTPFASTSAPFDGVYDSQTVKPLFVDAAPSGDDLLLVASQQDVLVLPRGQPFAKDPKGAGEPGNFLSIRTEFPPAEMIDSISGLAVAPEAAPDGRREVVIVGGFDRHPLDQTNGPSYGKIWRAWLGPDGLEPIETSTVVAGSFFRDVVISAGGHALAVGDLGTLYSRESYGAPFVPDTPLVAEYGPTDYANRIIEVPDETYSYLASTKGAIHTYDTRSQRWGFQRILQDVVVSPEPFIWFGLTAERTQSGLRFWGSASRGGLARREGTIEGWQRVHLFYPPRFSACASSRNPGEPLSFNRDITAAVLHRGYVHLAYENCTALVQVKIEDDGPGCASVLADATGRADFMPSYYRTLLPTARGLIALSSTGQVVTTTW